MRAGQLRHRLALQHGTATQDSSGDPVLAWTTLATVWGAYEPMADWESNKLTGRLEGCTGRVRIRYYADALPEHRLLFGARILHIAGIVNKDERNREMVLTVKEVEA